MKRLIITALLTLASLPGQLTTFHTFHLMAQAADSSNDTVFVTLHGKTYHTNRQCMSLAKSGKVLATNAKDAEAHGLHKCGICARRTKGKASDNGSFAKEVK